MALVLLLGCGVFFWATFQIQETNYGTLSSRVWPRLLLGLLTVFSLGLLAQAVARGRDETAKPTGSWLSRYRNALWCYGLFALFLLSLPYLGMLVGGALFVFACLTALGEPGWRRVPLHAAIALVSVGAMWAIFTFALRVFLPEGEWIPRI
ncbi:MAG: tripartite tricarboxylate transporter TctB family protein [Pseudomonadota bacterium]